MKAMSGMEERKYEEGTQKWKHVYHRMKRNCV